MTEAQRTILHVDMDAFFAAVEQHDHPELRGKPVVIGAPPDERGVVSAASYEAREFGIHSAMPSREAGRRCPHATFLPVNGRRYSEISHQVFAILERFTPLLEPLSIDEAFLDVTGSRRLFGDGPQTARAIKDAVLRETGLTCSVGVAPNKFLAKLASDLEKPDGLTVVPRLPDLIAAFLAPLPVGRMWGVGPVTATHLRGAGIETIGHLQTCPMDQLSALVGNHAARHLRGLALGHDERDLQPDQVEKSISREHTYGVDCESTANVQRTLCDLVEDVGGELRSQGRYAGLVRLKLRWHDFRTITRQHVLQRPICDDISLREAAMRLFAEQAVSQPVRLVGFGVSNLTDTPDPQLTLFDDADQEGERREALSRSIDSIRRRFGKGVIGRGGGGTT